MRSLIPTIPLILALGACSTVTDAFGTANTIFDEVREKGTDVSDGVLDKAATSFDAYCANAPDAVRSFLRAEINARTTQYDASDFCIPKGE